MLKKILEEFHWVCVSVSKAKAEMTLSESSNHHFSQRCLINLTPSQENETAEGSEQRSISPHRGEIQTLIEAKGVSRAEL